MLFFSRGATKYKFVFSILLKNEKLIFHIFLFLRRFANMLKNKRLKKISLHLLANLLKIYVHFLVIYCKTRFWYLWNAKDCDDDDDDDICSNKKMSLSHTADGLCKSAHICKSISVFVDTNARWRWPMEMMVLGFFKDKRYFVIEKITIAWRMDEGKMKWW